MAPPEPVHPHGHLIWRLSLRWRVAVDRALTPLGLTHAQYVALASLSALSTDGHAPSQRILADHTGLEPLYVSKLARGLEAAGLITREPDPADTRAVRLSLTPAGAEVTEKAVDVVRHLVAQLLEPLGGPESPRARQFREDLNTLLDLAPEPEGAAP
ncbi:MarR family transcriptional regulator [Kineosporia sp. NBRC 101731]|uniref:MarR family winged helix-turn-helix transcriptional regulator n=1 Tax=Kineosporia sp. NBRC 101731 TaxID=3032199 RepID=UPI0024A17A57|nr:MarR family transcriptional regulator [Kineosporia sp. NBRC 101731]GLY30244.1 MarR family transcriptional regulator [Kineosporia sp. NBRC 101731]